MKKIEHVGIVVGDLERSISFYRDVLGLPLLGTREIPGVKLAFLKLGEAQVELIEHTQPQERPVGVVDHLAFTVDDIDTWVARLKQHQVRLIHSEPQVVLGGCKNLFFYGPDGERLELFSPVPGFLEEECP